MLAESANITKVPQFGQMQGGRGAQETLSAISVQQQETQAVDDEEEQKQDVQVTQTVLDDLGKNLQIVHDVDLHFNLDEATGRTVVKITNSETGELIREVPPKEMLNLAAKMEDIVGILFDQKI